MFPSNKKPGASYLWSKGTFVFSERRAQHSPLTAAAFSCCRHSCDPWLGGSPGGRSGHASGSSPQVRALPGALEALISSAKWLVKLNPSYSCSLDVSSSSAGFGMVFCDSSAASWTLKNSCFLLHRESNYCIFSLSIKNPYTRITFDVAKSNSQKQGISWFKFACITPNVCNAHTLSHTL